MSKVSYFTRFYSFVYFRNLDWSSELYYIATAQQSSNGVCYYQVRDTEGELLKKTFYKQELNFVVRE